MPLIFVSKYPKLDVELRNATKSLEKVLVFEVTAFVFVATSFEVNNFRNT